MADEYTPKNPGSKKIQDELGDDDQRRKPVGGGKGTDNQGGSRRRRNFGDLYGENEPPGKVRPVPDKKS